MGRGAVAKRVGDDIVRLSHAGLDPLAFRAEVVARLEKVIPWDTYWFPTVDPSSLLVTGAVLKNIPEWAAPHFFENEYLRQDYNKFTDLVTGPTRVNSLFEATNGDLRQSERYRGLLHDLGLGDDLRVALVDGSACWGYMCFHRERGGDTYGPEDTSFLRTLVPHIAEGLRVSLLRKEQSTAMIPNEPGLMILARDLTVIAANDAAKRWLEELSAPMDPANVGLPDSICAAAARLWALERAETPVQLPPPSARARTRTGQWLTVHASRLGGTEGADHTAIIIETSDPLQIAPLIARAYGLSSRESEVTMLVLQGLSTREMSKRLGITENTVQDHLKAIFDKVGVRSRRDLAAQLSIRHYAPSGGFRSYKPGVEMEPHDWFFDETGSGDRVELPTDDER